MTDTSQQRACGACSLCCKLLPVAALNKPHDRWCTHCRPGNGGCTIYETRPQTCREFDCLWLAEPSVGEHWYPLQSKMVVQITGVHADDYDTFVDVHVDQAAPDAWRAEPYHSDLQRMSCAARTLVRVFYGDRTWFVRPDADFEAKRGRSPG
ncbi:MAG: YkgJ family cysteine cluster protein [Methylovirgula sp.]